MGFIAQRFFWSQSGCLLNDCIWATVIAHNALRAVYGPSKRPVFVFDFMFTVWLQLHMFFQLIPSLLEHKSKILLLHEELSLRIKLFVNPWGSQKLVLLLEGTKSRKTTAHFKNDIFINGIMSICSPLFGKLVSFVGAALATTQRLQWQFLRPRGDLVICVIAFEQDAIDLSFLYTKAQHTWIWWTTFGKSKFLWAIF